MPALGRISVGAERVHRPGTSQQSRGDVDRSGSASECFFTGRQKGKGVAGHERIARHREDVYGCVSWELRNLLCCR